MALFVAVAFDEVFRPVRLFTFLRDVIRLAGRKEYASICIWRNDDIGTHADRFNEVSKRQFINKEEAMFFGETAHLFGHEFCALHRLSQLKRFHFGMQLTNCLDFDLEIECLFIARDIRSRRIVVI